MIIRWYGTASVSIETKNSKILFDPFLPLAGSGINVSREDYKDFPNIFLTHGHMDHVASIPFLDQKSTIWCTKTPAKTLERKGIKEERIHLIQAGDRISLSDMEIEVLKGRHIQFDHQIVKKTLFSSRMIAYGYNIPWILYQNSLCKENGETVSYVVRAENKTILILGSLGLAPEVAYPTKVDLLILPFQGASDLITPSLDVIEKIQPKRIMFDHFDNSFPPISNKISLAEMKKWLKYEYPKIKAVKPKYKKAVHLP